MARTILDQLAQTGRVVRGWLGVSIQDLTADLAEQFGVPDTKGVLVSDVLADSPAQRAGVLQGDVITEFDGKPVDGPTQLRNLVAKAPVGRAAAVTVIRVRRTQVVRIQITEQPQTVAQADAPAPAAHPEPAGARGDLDVRDLTPDLADQLQLPGTERGVVVMGVRPGGTAEEAGLKSGDIILEVNRRRVPSVHAYQQAVAGSAVDRPVLLLVRRQGATTFVTMKRTS
jgi:serine protease Do